MVIFNSIIVVYLNNLLEQIIQMSGVIIGLISIIKGAKNIFGLFGGPEYHIRGSTPFCTLFVMDYTASQWI